MKWLAKITFSFLGLGLHLGCTYRFSNLHANIPTGIQAIAVEAVYDTSKAVLPHEILWESIQQAFAQNGRLKLVGQDNADALVRMHLQQASIQPYGSPNISDIQKREEPKLETGDQAPAPEDFPDLNIAKKYTPQESLAITVKVEVWDLHTHKLIMSQNYALSQAYSVALASAQPNEFLLREEVSTVNFKRMANDIANRVIEDLLIKI